jgi:YbbR domain-containing protein
VRFSGTPPAGYRVARQQVHPRTLTIVGPETRVKRVEYVETDPIDLARSGGETQFHVHTFIPDPQVRFVSPSAVDVLLSLERTR